MTNVQTLLAACVIVAQSSMALGANVVPGTQDVAPGGGASVQQGVTDNKPVSCPDNTPRDANDKCPDPQKTVSGSGTSSNSSTSAVPASSMK